MDPCDGIRPVQRVGEGCKARTPLLYHGSLAESLPLPEEANP